MNFTMLHDGPVHGSMVYVAEATDDTTIVFKAVIDRQPIAIVESTW